MIKAVAAVQLFKIEEPKESLAAACIYVLNLLCHPFARALT